MTLSEMFYETDVFNQPLNAWSIGSNVTIMQECLRIATPLINR